MGPTLGSWWQLGNGEAFLRCLECGSEFPLDQGLVTCPRCGGLLEVVFRPARVDLASLRGRGVWRYRPLIPGDYPKVVSLGEGSTPLVRSSIFKSVYYKLEGSNPTGSFKDRGMTVAVSLAASMGYGAVVAASTGNTAASAAAYAARAGMRCYVVLPRGRVAAGKLAQALLHGATVVEVEGGFDEAMGEVLRLYRSRRAAYPLNSFNPWRLEGQKTLAFEVFEEIGVPDNVVVPVGNGGNIYAIWKGFAELAEAGLADRVPRMIGVQAEGAAPIASAIARGLEEPAFVDEPRTVASAIRIGRPVNWRKALKAIRSSGGTAVAVSDAEILEAQALLARREGIGVEPASAAALAGYLKLLRQGVIGEGEVTVVVLTGHALKDPDVVALLGGRVVKLEGSLLELIESDAGRRSP